MHSLTRLARFLQWNLRSATPGHLTFPLSVSTGCRHGRGGGHRGLSVRVAPPQALRKPRMNNPPQNLSLVCVPCHQIIFNRPCQQIPARSTLKNLLPPVPKASETRCCYLFLVIEPSSGFVENVVRYPLLGAFETLRIKKHSSISLSAGQWPDCGIQLQPNPRQRQHRERLDHGAPTSIRTTTLCNSQADLCRMCVSLEPYKTTQLLSGSCSKLMPDTSVCAAFHVRRETHTQVVEPSIAFLFSESTDQAGHLVLWHRWCCTETRLFSSCLAPPRRVSRSRSKTPLRSKLCLRSTSTCPARISSMRLDCVSPLSHSFRDQIHFMEATIPEPRFEAMYGLVQPKPETQTRNTTHETSTLNPKPKPQPGARGFGVLRCHEHCWLFPDSLSLPLSLTHTHTPPISPSRPLRCVCTLIAGQCQRQHRIFFPSLTATCPLTSQTNAPTSSRRCR